MNELGKKLFSGPALALYQNTRITALRALYGEYLGFQKYMIIADQPIYSLEPLDFLPQAVDFIFQAGVFESVLDCQFKFIEVDGFDQVVESAVLYCSDYVFYPLVCCYHDNGRARTHFLETGQQLKAASVGQSDIEQNEVWIFALGKH
jgi:hypothetical protein